jgi:hypothetical protein
MKIRFKVVIPAEAKRRAGIQDHRTAAALDPGQPARLPG